MTLLLILAGVFLGTFLGALVTWAVFEWKYGLRSASEGSC
jgi:ABC-type cobalamin transport system permease subunit